MFTIRFQAWVRRLALRGAARLERLPLTPNQVTLAGLGVTLGAAALIASGRPFYGGLTLLFAGAFDILDGALARASQRSYAYGAFLDSTTDRFAEGAVMVALLVFFQRHGVELGPVLVILGLAGSFLVSYVRARAQSLGFTCEGGLLARPERVLLTVVGLLLTPVTTNALLFVVGLLAVFANFTAIQRVWIVWRQSRRMMESGPPTSTTTEPTDARGPRRNDTTEVRPGPEPAGG